MKKEFKELTGNVFGRLTVVSRGPNTKEKCAQFYCLCSCGNEKLIRSRSLLSGKTVSCGCHNSDKTKIFNSLTKRTHGHKANGGITPEYQAWTSMIDRTTNPNCTNFHRYGGRGISVCDRWRNSFEDFFADMGNRPSIKHSLDRKDYNGNYEPSNCRWATRKEQSRNLHNNVRVPYKGESLTLQHISEKTGVPYTYLRYKKQTGISMEQAEHEYNKREGKI